MANETAPAQGAAQAGPRERGARQELTGRGDQRQDGKDDRGEGHARDSASAVSPRRAFREEILRAR